LQAKGSIKMLPMIKAIQSIGDSLGRMLDFSYDKPLKTSQSVEDIHAKSNAINEKSLAMLNKSLSKASKSVDRELKGSISTKY